MTGRPRARWSQRCRTLVFAAAMGVVLTSISVVDRSWPGIVVGPAGTVIALVLFRRECWGDSRTNSRDT